MESNDSKSKNINNDTNKINEIKDYFVKEQLSGDKSFSM